MGDLRESNPNEPSLACSNLMWYKALLIKEKINYYKNENKSQK